MGLYDVVLRMVELGTDLENYLRRPKVPHHLIEDPKKRSHNYRLHQWGEDQKSKKIVMKSVIIQKRNE